MCESIRIKLNKVRVEVKRQPIRLLPVTGDVVFYFSDMENVEPELVYTRGNHEIGQYVLVLKWGPIMIRMASWDKVCIRAWESKPEIFHVSMYDSLRIILPFFVV